MENREILIANTRTQRREKLESTATTLGELKREMREAGIDYSGMTFTEGISKTQLLDDSTPLPQNLTYKGQQTNTLVILLTNTKKNIASGAMSRKETYQAIKDNNWQEEVKEEFGRNFTQVPTTDLIYFINSKNFSCPEEEDKEVEEKEEVKMPDYEKKDIIEDIPCSLEDMISDSRITTVADSLAVHIAMLAMQKCITLSDVKELRDSIEDIIESMEYEEKQKAPQNPVSTSDGSIKDDDIDNMINDLGI